MSDLISRQEAIDLLKQMRKDGDMIPWEGKDVFARIRKLPPAQPEQRWIPCSERLPKEYGEFLVTMTEKAKAKDLGFDIDETYIRKMRYNSNGWQLPRYIPSWINEAVKDEVLAWMPLPEPYQEEGELFGNSEQLPSADVQPVVHGEWIKTMEGNAFRDKCSECESLYPNAFGYNWCPNCGADMRGEGGK